MKRTRNKAGPKYKTKPELLKQSRRVKTRRQKNW